MEVTYTPRFLDCWRCQIKALTMYPVLWTVIIGVHLLFAFINSGEDGAFDLNEFYNRAFWPIVRFVILYVPVMSFFVLTQCRICTMALRYDGIYYITHQRTAVLPWRNITAIRTIGGDLFFSGDLTLAMQGKTGLFVPRTAFPSSVEAQAFADAGARIRAGDFSMLQTQQPDDVWPPPPAVPD
ncbi:MAG: hypothetical protein ACLQVD_00520 [Capsulimonadaceae bacterium]